MKIDEVLDKWFDETFSMYQEKVRPPRRSDLLVMGVLRYSRHCSITTFLLLEHGAKLSTMVLLRAFLELYIKFLWCLIKDTDSQKNHQEQVYDRFKRWDYKRLLEQKRNLGKRLEISNVDSRSDIDETIKNVDNLIEEYKRQKIKCIPDVWQILKEISETEEFRKTPETILGVYPNLYQKFSQAVYPNMDFIRKMVIKTETAYVCNCDVEEDIQELRLLLISMSCDINRMIRDFYGWDSAEMQKEYKLISKQLNG